MRSVRSVLFVLAGLAMGALAAPNAQAGDFSRPGLYASIGGVYAVDLYEDEIEDALGSDLLVDIDESQGIAARVGMRLLSALAVELQYEWVDEYDINIDSASSAANATVALTQHTLTANLKLYLPIWRVQPYLLAGVGFQRLEADGVGQFAGFSLRDQQADTALAGRVGLGLEVYLTEHIALFGEGLVVMTDERLELATGGDIENIFYAGGSAGLVYRF